MKKLLLSGIAALLLATGTAQAGDKFERAIPAAKEACEIGDQDACIWVCAKKHPGFGPFSFPRLRCIERLEQKRTRGGDVPSPRPRPNAPVLTYPGESFDAWLEKSRPPVPHRESQRYFSAREAFPGITLTPSWMMTTRGSRAAGAPLPTPGSLPDVEMLPVPTDWQIARAAQDRIPVYTRDGRAMAPYSTMPLPGFNRDAFYNFLRNQPPSTNIEDRRGEIQPTIQPGERPAMPEA